MEFGVDARSNEVVVAYQAMLVSAGGKTVTQRRFEVREPIGGEVEAKTVGEALTRAATRVAAGVVDGPRGEDSLRPQSRDGQEGGVRKGGGGRVGMRGGRN